MGKKIVNTINSSAKLIEGSRKSSILLPEGAVIKVNKVPFYSKFRRNLLSFTNIVKMDIMLR